MNLRLFLYLWCCLLFLGCSQEIPKTPPPNIVWITSEDNSIHYLKLFHPDGVETPNIQQLASQGIVFRNAYSNAPVCSVARSALISGCFGPRTGSQFHRKIQQVPLPGDLKMFPAYLRNAGYYTANNSKEDYNFYKGEDVWDESSKKASYRHRESGQPFFYVHNFTISHESSLHFNAEQMDTTSTVTPYNTFRVFPNHPDTDLFRYTNAYYRDKIREMDRKVGEVMDQLKEDGLLDNTIIFYFGDHGGVLPGSKGYLYETGLHVPLVVYVPPVYRELAGITGTSEINGLVSFVDFGPTVLRLAGVEVPMQMDGQPFMGPGVTVEDLNQRNTAFSYADRFDEKYDLVRAVRKGRYKYIRNYQPFNFDGLMNNYRYKMLAYQQWDSLYRAGVLNPVQAMFFKTRPPEMLFDLEQDPFETKNLAADPNYQQTLIELRSLLTHWIGSMPDLSFYPEHYLIRHALEDPVGFGQSHQESIVKYGEIADLSLEPFEQVKTTLTHSLESSDPWERYWALITCSVFAEQASGFRETISRLSMQDEELINRVRAAEYLGLTGLGDPVEVMTSALYASRQPAEALLILNSMVLMGSENYQYEFDIERESINRLVAENDEVSRRLLFLKGE